MKAEITVLAGDGIVPEITEHALNILNAIEKKYGHEFTLHDALSVSYTHLTLPTILLV